MYFTVYHLQINKQFKQLNQTAEIILQYFITVNLKNYDWSSFLSFLWAILNNSKNCLTDKLLNKVIYSFNL